MTDAALRPFPQTATVRDDELLVGDLPLSQLAAEYGTPLLVLCEETLRRRARAFRDAAGAGLVAYGSKAFPNVALIRLFAEEGLATEVWSAGELAFARAAGVPGEDLIFNGIDKTDEELTAAARLGARYVVLDSADEAARAAAADVRRVLVRLTAGVTPSRGIRTGGPSSKFGVPERDVVSAIETALGAGLDVRGLHSHVGSQLMDRDVFADTVSWLARMARRCADRLGFVPEVLDLGGGLGIAYVDGDEPLEIPEYVDLMRGLVADAWAANDLPVPDLVFEPGRPLVGPAGLTLYTVGGTKTSADGTRYAIVDGGISDNPRPHLYQAPFKAMHVTRPYDVGERSFVIAGKHCEPDILVRECFLRVPQRGDVIAVPATGAYTLAMGSNYNGMLRPAAVLVRGGEATVVQRREEFRDLLACQTAKIEQYALA